MEEPILNQPKKDYCTPMHTAEHILNQTMVRTFGCTRSVNAHIEKKKSKCDYVLSICPTDEELQAIEDKVNEIIVMNLDVTEEFMPSSQAQAEFDLTRLPDDASDTLRIVRVGNYDACPCIGMHVKNTSEIGEFKIISHDYEDGRLRLRFKLI
jgi:Ser-tRNA(Ala) deacylase AlaX